MNTPASAPCRLCHRPCTAAVHDGCRARTDEALESLPGLYTALASALVPGSAGGVGPVTGSRTPPIPAALGPLSLRARGGIEGVLTTWESDWRDLLGYTAVPWRGTVEQTVTGSVRFLRGNLLWAAEQHPAVDEFAREVGDTVRACRAALGERSDVRVIGRCPALLDDGTECGRQLRASPESEVIVCRGCSASWPRATWMTLGAVLREQEAAA